MLRKLMHVGPSMTSYEVQLEGVRENVGFASPEFLEAMRNSLEGLRIVVGADNSYLPFILPGSGTVAMESVTSILPRKGKVLVASNGVFGNRWKPILDAHRMEYEVLEAEPGKSVDPASIKDKLSSGNFASLVFTHVETSTGVRADIEEICRKARPLVDRIVVDGVASVGGETLKVKEWGIDAIITASQKGLASPPGAALLVVAKDSLNNTAGDGYFFDLKNWVEPMNTYLKGENGYLSTEPVGVVMALSHVFNDIRAEGLENTIKRHRVFSEALNEGLEEIGLKVLADREHWSNTVTAVVAERSDDIVKFALSMGIEFATGVHPKLKGKYFRIGHMGYFNYYDVFSALSVIERSALRAGINIKLGSGLTRAQEILIKNGV
ncbi:aspartate aminotransferase [Thermoplasma volcanium GSS1]|uniref:Aspartate aminotransferase n=1 Tax=Thermoplasma volcanium (strain ATCC 51530 / DSM 4299 / JCM 9571 / NBRC 15438 / GSS1) TaxID=273116 RepID=Q97B87_THEVO|nr:alanine--glyoxylate aminotransferase family protein [Thermoplasma volcanium]BAB59712.1 aspartate aminotransferase [Thermoplasma volcanium GSS1]